MNSLAVGWGVVTVVNMAWPRAETADEPWHEQYAALLFTGILVIIGVAYYVLVQLNKTNVLAEHHAS